MTEAVGKGGGREFYLKNPNRIDKPKPTSDNTSKTLPVFTPADLSYIGILLTSPECKSASEMAGIELDQMKIEAIRRNRRRMSTEEWDDYFNLNGRMKAVNGTIADFANLPPEDRKAFLQSDPQAEMVLGPISHLAKDDLISWYHTAHHYLAMNSLSGSYHT